MIRKLLARLLPVRILEISTERPKVNPELLLHLAELQHNPAFKYLLTMQAFKRGIFLNELARERDNAKRTDLQSLIRSYEFVEAELIAATSSVRRETKTSDPTPLEKRLFEEAQRSLTIVGQA